MTGERAEGYEARGLATPRVPPIAPGSDPALADVERRLIAGRGGISQLYRVLFNSPPVADGWEQLLSSVRRRTGLPAALREAIILRVAVLNRASYEFDAHLPHARAAGLGDAAIEALRWDAVGAPFDPVEQLALACTDELTRTAKLGDASFARLAEHFAPRELVELVVTIAAYNMVSRVLNALAIR